MPKVVYVFRYRLRNWREYSRALIHRGGLTVWFGEQAIIAWSKRRIADLLETLQAKDNSLTMSYLD